MSYTLADLEILARSALKHWGLSDADLDLVKHRENAVYSVTSGSGARFALRVHRIDYHTDAELRSELQWMQALDEYGVNTPPIVSAQDGSLIVKVSTEAIPQGCQCDLLEWIDGAALGAIEGNEEADPEDLVANFRLVGKLMAKLHNHAEEWLLPDGFTRHAWDIDGIVGKDPFWGRYWELEALTHAQVDLVQAAAEIVRHKLDEFGQSSDRYGLIHADFLPENLLVDGETMRLIDFDDAGFGWHLFDVATSVFFFVGEEPFDAILEALVEGYRTERKLSDEHLEMLPTFLMARGLTYLGWLHTRKETETAQELTPVVVDGVCALAEEYCS